MYHSELSGQLLNHGQRDREFLTEHGTNRSANRGAPKAAIRIQKGMLSQAVAKAMQPSFFFAMFEDDVQEFVMAEAMRSRTSMQVLLCSSSSALLVSLHIP